MRKLLLFQSRSVSMAPTLARGKKDAEALIPLRDAVSKRLAERIEAERARAAPSEGESP